MKFVCKFDDFKHEIQAGTVEYRQGAGNQAIPVQTSPHLVAEFTRGVILTGAEREACRQKFDGSATGMWSGEQPGAQRHDGVFGIGAEGSIMGDAGDGFFVGSKAEFLYSVFDTEDETRCPPQYRDAFEAVLSADAAACRAASERHNFIGTWALKPTTDLRAGDLVWLDKLMIGTVAIETADGLVVTTAGQGPRWAASFPWPTYDEMAFNPQVPKKIAETCDLIGLDKDEVAQYELAHKQRPSIIAALTGIKIEEAKAAIAEFKARPAVEPVAPPRPTRQVDEDGFMIGRQMDGAPASALTEDIRFGDFVQP